MSSINLAWKAWSDVAHLLLLVFSVVVVELVHAVGVVLVLIFKNGDIL